jgi:uroporphyrinogen decarboxylase
MHYRPRDRAPLYDFNYWDETLPEWHKQGLPATVTRRNSTQFFGQDCSLGGGEPPGWNVGAGMDLSPGFSHEILQDFGDECVERQPDGVIVRKQRSSVSIPMHVGHTLTDRESWRREYLPRLQPDTPARWPKTIAPALDRQRTHPCFTHAGSLFGRFRDWMGMENIALVPYDDPAWFEEMVTTKADLIIAMLTRLFEAGARFEACGMWEDMCYNAGPLLSPEHFRQYLVPHYRRISELCRKYGCDVLWVDCDGKIDDLLPLWLDAGINCMFPLEIGTWGADPVQYRRQYGKDLLLMGGFDKHILAKGPADIEREVLRLAPLVEEGGFIPMPDHRVPPDVPYENFLCYLRVARKIWGHDTDLKPLQA